MSANVSVPLGFTGSPRSLLFLNDARKRLMKYKIILKKILGQEKVLLNDIQFLKTKDRLCRMEGDCLSS